ncbi:ESX secretion-associated protein EspG [Umezawaea sp. Da 62-37]|uniref:ESX secretion-associated protein EspG n=1 Tax=Umezawaea sp. Da 62-37 TaxID=3075927 RepID=UPI0028F6EFEA|nr:ESX secretion-associated protein EspG [Umezawaea sp. Da 62-37]WNV82078.1 ESX secretion-associated protein EspG [Umezawaea sp. Da 62-37]
MIPFTLSRLEYDVLWSHLGLGPFPTVLRVDGHGRTRGERDALAVEAWKSLWDKEYGRPDDLDPALDWCLRVLARPEWEVDARLHLSADGPRTSALVASRGGYAVVSTLDAESLVLRTTEVGAMARTAAALLPEHPPGPRRSTTVPAADLDEAAGRAGRDAGALVRELQRQGLANGQAQDIADVLGAVLRFGQFGVGRTPPGGRRTRAGHVVSFYDSPAGRFSFTRGRKGTHQWVTLVGTDGHLLARQIDELREGLA